ncbi:PREDICTED: zymogen granule protein 16 homolog B [Chrysochloris asiatica]|uniref:Zymogen granule protein 16 homolog B n=1 Tax=Chrysochloris asiatica TaxID=185453 RepID=A0A9B0U181_CHRAS|nr:PREDICTED: zymogen granule protein 16 homolog B [Chrysochloris asiatica]
MLLWLTIAILGIPSSWADPIYGKGRGKYFSTVNNGNDITAIRVCLDVFGVMKSIDLRFGLYWTGKYGSRFGKCEEANLHPGEHITQIHGTYNHFLRSLVLHTDKKRQITFGKNTGYTFFAFPQTKGQVLTGVFGNYKLMGLTSLGFMWEFPLDEGTVHADELGDLSWSWCRVWVWLLLGKVLFLQTVRLCPSAVLSFLVTVD